MEMFAALVRITMCIFFFFSFSVHVMGTTWKLHHNHLSKSQSCVFRAAFYFPSEWKGKKAICWRLTIHHHRLTEKKNPCWKFTCCLVVWWFICALCLAESGRKGNLVLFVSCAIPLHVVSVEWLLVHRGPSQPAETAMCQFYYAYCCVCVFLNGGKLLCCCLSVWFFFLPSLSLVFTISLCALRHFHAQLHSFHLHLWHFHLFFCFFSLCLHICLCHVLNEY